MRGLPIDVSVRPSAQIHQVKQGIELNIFHDEPLSYPSQHAISVCRIKQLSDSAENLSPQAPNLLWLAR